MSYPAASRNLIGLHATVVGVDAVICFSPVVIDHPRLTSFMHSPVLVGKYSSGTFASFDSNKIIL
jgi:hypothetical protein